MANAQVLSNFGVRYFLLSLEEGAEKTATKESNKIKITSEEKLITAAQDLGDADEIVDVLSCNPGAINKDIKTFKTLNGDGWDSAVSLGQNMSEGSMNLIRTGTGDAYEGSADDSTATYNKLRKWMSESTASGGVNAARALVELVPRGASAYEGYVYRCVPTSFDPGERNTSDGQEFSVGFQCFGKPISASVTVQTSTSSTATSRFTISNPT